jgi:hypothetical protein
MNAAGFDALLERCKARDLLITAPRRAVLMALAGAAGPLDAVACLQLAQRHYPATGLGTVYRFLRELEKLGILHASVPVHGRRQWQAHVPPSIDDTATETVRLLAQIAACLGYRLVPDGAAVDRADGQAY